MNFLSDFDVRELNSIPAVEGRDLCVEAANP